MPQELLTDFLIEARERLEDVEEQLLALPTSSPGDRPGRLLRVRRSLHTLKGNAGMMGLSDLQTLAHELENRVEALRPARPALGHVLADLDRFRHLLDSLAGSDDSSARSPAGHGPAGLRVPLATLDSLMETLAELVLHRNRLEAAQVTRNDATTAARRELPSFLQVLGKTIDRLQAEMQRLRMVPLRALFRHLRRIVHDEGVQSQRQVVLELSGGDTPLDRALLEVASDTLGHLVRNAVVHAMEGPSERRRGAKPAHGTVWVRAVRGAGEVAIEVEDDGRGIDAAALRRRARQRGLSLPADLPLQDLLFRPGLSTRTRTDLEAGRGVGLDAVKSAVESHGGRIEVETQPGKGTLFRLRLPIHVSILRALLVRSDDQVYAVPLGQVAETLRLPATLRPDSELRWRRRRLPLIDLGSTLGTATQPRPRFYALVVHHPRRPAALAVDEVTGIRDLVVRPLDPIVAVSSHISGAAVLADGRAVLILDPQALSTAKDREDR